MAGHRSNPPKKPKRKLTKKQTKRVKKLQEGLKGKKGVANPFALARFLVQRTKKKMGRKRR